MALKRNLSDTERFGLTEEEIKIATKYLRKHKTAGAVPEVESMKLYEMYMIGCSFHEIQQQHPQYELSRIILTAALRGWTTDREKMMGSLRDRVQAKVVKSVIEQVDFLTAMLSVVNAEQLDAMKKYILDPMHNPKPAIRVENIKEYKEVVETLHKLVAGATSKNNKSSAMFDALSTPPTPKQLSPKSADENVIDLDSALEAEESNV